MKQRNLSRIAVKILLVVFWLTVFGGLFWKLPIFPYRSSRVTGVELLLHVLDFGEEPRYREAYRQVTHKSKNETLGWELTPNFRSLFDGEEVRLDRITHIRINSQGFRDREFPIDKPPDVFRIAVTGDSFTYGHGVETDETYDKLLEEKLNEREGALTYEVLNFGVPGYALSKCAEQLRVKILAFSPDLFIVGTTLANDLKGPEDRRITDCGEHREFCLSKIEPPLRKIRALCTKDGIPVLTVYLLHDGLGGWELLQPLCERHGLDHLSMATTLFARDDFDTSKTFIPVDGHFTAFGHRVIADEIHRYLMESGLVDDADAMERAS